MSTNLSFVFSYVLLWILVLLLSVVVLFVGRQIGNLYQRLGPAGAMMANPGPELNSFVEPLPLKDVDGNVITVGGKRRRNSLLIFMSPGCPSCADIASGVRAISRHDRGSLDVVVLSVGSDIASHREFRLRHGVHHLPYVVSDDARTKMNITAVPYALLIDEKGILRSKGLVNSLAHLESLLNQLDLNTQALGPQAPANQQIQASA